MARMGGHGHLSKLSHSNLGLHTVRLMGTAIQLDGHVTGTIPLPTVHPVSFSVPQRLWMGGTGTVVIQ